MLPPPHPARTAPHRSDIFSTVTGGEQNSAVGYHGAVGGGLGNRAGDQGAVGGGANNTATGLAAVIPGGLENTATGKCVIWSVCIVRFLHRHAGRTCMRAAHLQMMIELD